MAILNWKCKGSSVIAAAKPLGFKVGTDLVELSPSAAPAHDFTQTALDITQSYFVHPMSGVRRPRSATGIYFPKKEHAQGCRTGSTGMYATSPHSISGYL